jgi:hypothetical protein
MTEKSCLDGGINTPVVSMALLGETPTNEMVNGYPRLHEVAIMGLAKFKRTRGSICGLDSDFAHI